jgi:hypothetical protein
MRYMKMVTATCLVVGATVAVGVGTASAATPTPCLMAYCNKAYAVLVPHPMHLPPSQQRTPCTTKRKITLTGGTFLWELTRGNIRGATRTISVPAGTYLWQDCMEEAEAGASYSHQAVLQWASTGAYVATLTGVTNIFSRGNYDFGSELVRLSYSAPPHAHIG